MLALGGASWPRLGSDGAWVETLSARGVAISPLRPANCGFTVAWSGVFRDRFEGQPLKGAALSFGKRMVRGEAVMTRAGIEGGAVYALSADLREAIDAAGQATLRIALRPDLERGDLVRRLSMPRGKQSVSNWLRKAVHLAPIGIGLLQEAAMASAVSLASLSPADLADWINAVPIQLDGIAPIARAISTAGGIALDELDADFMIRSLARHLRCRRNARLGGADRRLSAAGLVRHRCGGGQGRIEMAGPPSLRANGSREARPMTGSAKQSIVRDKEWIASSQVLLAMTMETSPQFSARGDR